MIIKSKGQLNHPWATARQALGNAKKGALNNMALARGRAMVEKIQKKMARPKK